MSDNNRTSAEERRAFLKGTVLAAGTTVVASAASQAAEASDPMPGRSIHLAVKGGVQAKAVHAALDRIFELVGCVACGFNGILDLRINVVNPASDRFSKEGILGASGNLRGL
jgi:hypothetical protein